MNILEQWIDYNNEDPNKVMDLLQAHGVVSDNSVTAAEVCDADAEAAVRFLEE